MIDFESMPFRLMRFGYGVQILLFLQNEGKAHQSQIRKALGSEFTPVHRALEFMVEHGIILKHDLPEGRRIHSIYSLSKKGERIAHTLKVCYDQLIMNSQD